MLSDPNVLPEDMPPEIKPQRLSFSRQKYLHDIIRKHVLARAKDILCLLPTVPEAENLPDQESGPSIHSDNESSGENQQVGATSSKAALSCLRLL